MAPFLALVVLALFAPLVYSDEPADEVLLWAIAAGPGVMLTAVVVGRLTSGLEQSREAYRQLSTEDGLTGVGNYRSLIERLRHETARHQRRGREFAVLTLDLDNFKTVNETQGHLVGDLRPGDHRLDARPQGPHRGCRLPPGRRRVLGDRARDRPRCRPSTSRRRIEDAVMRVSSGDVRISASVGCAVFPHDGTEAGELLDSADAALLARKRTSVARGSS